MFNKKKPIIMFASKVSEADRKNLEKGGYVVVENVKPQEARILGDSEAVNEGKAEFLGEGTVEEFEQSKKEDEGTAPWYKRILNL
jgi:hypothetical protein